MEKGTAKSAPPLTGLKVVALEQAVAAPFATARLADAGATVLKIERPEGDFARGYDRAAGGLSSYFVWLNRGKRSICLDLGEDAGRARLKTLIEGADVFVQNLKPGVARRLGFDPARLCETHPRLVCCSITGFREEGVNGARKAYDLLIQAECGLASITGTEGRPSRVGISIVDIAAGATAHAAILEALIGRSVTGRGADLRVSMFDVMADWMTVPLLCHEAGLSPRQIGLAHPSIAPYGVFDTADGVPILISIQSEREWRQFCASFLERPDAVTDPLTATNIARVRNRRHTDGMVAEVFAKLDAAEAVKKLVEADTAYALVNDLNGLSAHADLARMAVGTKAGNVMIPMPGVRRPGVDLSPGPVPEPGEFDEGTKRQ